MAPRSVSTGSPAGDAGGSQPQHVVGADEVDLQHILPEALQRCGLSRLVEDPQPVTAAPRTMHRTTQRPMTGSGAAERIGQGLLVGDVDGREHRGRTEPFGHRLTVRRRQVGDDHLATGADDSRRRGLTETRRPAGDQECVVLKLHQCFRPLQSCARLRGGPQFTMPFEHRRRNGLQFPGCPQTGEPGLAVAKALQLPLR